MSLSSLLLARLDIYHEKQQAIVLVGGEEKCARNQ